VAPGTGEFDQADAERFELLQVGEFVGEETRGHGELIPRSARRAKKNLGTQVF
jgi:hypothetical protein